MNRFAVKTTINSLADIINGKPRDQDYAGKPASLPEFVEKVYDPWEVASKTKEQVPLENCVDKVVAESICCYPPGIYVCHSGERISSGLMQYLCSQRGRSHIYADDRTLKNITVVRE
jgi:arginine/lysine/ornithine decarboxylase